MEELIKRLERVIQTGVPDKDGMHPISAETVLEVVKAQLSTNLAEVGTDCISRQAAIDALRDYLVGKRCPDDGTLTCRLIENEVVNKLPSALSTNLAEVGTDCISRQAALDALNHELRCGAVINQCGLEMAYEVIEGLPPAEPKMGRWIHHPEIGWGETWLCDQCGEKTTSTVMGKPRANFCPNCGADMRGEEHGLQ